MATTKADLTMNCSTSCHKRIRNTAISSVTFALGLSLIAAITVFPDEIYRAPETWARRAYPNLIYFHEVDKGGHFAAWEQPQLFSEELRAAFKSFRGDKATALNR